MTKKAVKKNTILKKFTTGSEVEFFIIDKKEGTIAHGADEILKRVSEIAKERANNIVKESSGNLIEVGSYPDVDGANVMTNLTDALKQLLYAADELGYAIFPLGAYPGAFTPSMRTDARYRSQQSLLGKHRFRISGRCAGYHCHHSLPRGIFDANALMLKELDNSKHLETLLNMYNFAVAIDPALTTFMQSSPFYQGKHFAKDTRMVAYRGGEQFGPKIKGMYSNFPRFGALPPYEHSGTDIIQSIRNRHEEFMVAMANAGVSGKGMPKYDSVLRTNWAPVKISAHGTLEQRGMDMNHLPIVLSVSMLLSRTLDHIQKKSYKIMPHDLAKSEPFKLEGKTIYVPPDTHVREHLQRLSALEGLGNDEVYTYCKRLMALMKLLDGAKGSWRLRPLEEMLEGRQTTSDKVLAQAKSLGHKDLKKPLPQGIAAEIAKTHSKQVFEDIILMQEMIQANNRFPL
ncbi:MAG: glutamate-cysteine ligase family protein [Patescibacteria group bacterium]|nr:glutamate-cysteine ligase family protein [Patescibacteria group bacterium]